MILQIPETAEVRETPSSTFWFDEHGILYSISKPQPRPRTLEEINQEMEDLRKILGNRKVCIIMESESRVQVPKEQRDAIAAELDSVLKALAIISSSPLSRMIANLFFSFKPPKYPMKLFSSHEEARNWILKYL